MGNKVWQLWNNGYSIEQIGKLLCMDSDIVMKVLIGYVIWNN